MTKIIITLDYEIHGNGDGCPFKLMVEPTKRLMKLMDSFGAKLTIFADMAEIYKFKEFYEKTGIDKFHYLIIKEQLQQAIIEGHDVQLHIHSSYFNGSYNGGNWLLDWNEYNLSGLDYDIINNRITMCKNLLESIIREKVPEYECRVFRAANWAMQPTNSVAKSLLNNGIYIDSSVYKFGKQTSWVSYDYTSAYQQTFPYKASINDICLHDPQSPLWEFPIHCELRPFWDFITPIRLFRLIRAKFHKHERNPQQDLRVHNPSLSSWEKPFKLKVKFPRKYDFNQLSGSQMIRQLENITEQPYLPEYITLIGHSKTFISYNEFTLRKYFDYVVSNGQKYAFSLFPRLINNQLFE